MIELTETGLDEMIARLERMQANMQANLSEGIHERADTTTVRFIGCTPRDTGLTADDWHPEDRGVLEVAVVNRRTSARGFLVASGLLTGTGDRGAGATPAAGYLGGFTPGWAGMLPAAALQSAWNDEATTTLATPEMVARLTA